MTTNILAFCGSLRQGSYNHMLLKQAQILAPAGVNIEIADISAVPLYNADVQEQGFPQAVLDLGAKVAAADAVLFASPEYNYSVPGVLKNTIDWLSRLPDAPFKGKPAAIMGASVGGMGTSRCQYHLRQILVFLDVHPLNKPEVFVSGAHHKFGPDGHLTDADLRSIIVRQLEALVSWSQKIS